MFGKIDWLWFIIGIVFALFIIPMVQAWFSARRQNRGDVA